MGLYQLLEAWLSALGDGWEGSIPVGREALHLAHRDGAWFELEGEVLRAQGAGLRRAAARANRQASRGVGELFVSPLSREEERWRTTHPWRFEPGGDS